MQRITGSSKEKHAGTAPSLHPPIQVLVERGPVGLSIAGVNLKMIDKAALVRGGYNATCSREEWMIVFVPVLSQGHKTSSSRFDLE